MIRAHEAEIGDQEAVDLRMPHTRSLAETIRHFLKTEDMVGAGGTSEPGRRDHVYRHMEISVKKRRDHVHLKHMKV